MVVMIFGNPYNFAIITQPIKEWNEDDTFLNGVLLFCVDGKIFPKNIVNATLKFELSGYEEKLNNLVVDNKLYNTARDTAFRCIYNLVYPNDRDTTDNDYRFDFSPEIFSDINCKVFAISNGESIRLMAAANLVYNKVESRHILDDVEVSETTIPIKEFQEIISQLKHYYR